MKQLFLLRHAHSDIAKDDFNRPINKNGINKCSAIKEIIKNYSIDMFFISSATRAIQTFDNINNTSSPNIDQTDSLYNALSEDILNYIKENATPNYNNILLISHNPGISDLGLFLSSQSMESISYQNIKLGFSPGSLALYQCNITSWNEIEPEKCRLTSFWL
jgi:phosphohistidine phosphatase SixA